MGRKTKDKVKEKKAAHKAHLAQLTASQERVAAANALADPLAHFTAFQRFDRNGLKISVSCSRVSALDAATVELVFDLTKRNMETLYETSDWGWRDKDKRDELTEDSAWYLLCRDEEGALVAFVHFRFDLEEECEVLYLYEIQLEKRVRRKGLGRFLVAILTLMGKKNEMAKIVCTVFSHNHDSMAFFKDSCRFEVDETSPDAMIDLDEPVCYQILCKRITSSAKTTESPAAAANPALAAAAANAAAAAAASNHH